MMTSDYRSIGPHRYFMSFSIRFIRWLPVLALTVALMFHSFLNAPNTAADEPAGVKHADPVTDFSSFAIYARTAPRAGKTTPIATRLPLTLNHGDRIAWVGNTLGERTQWFGHFEAMLHQQFPQHQLVVPP